MLRFTKNQCETPKGNAKQGKIGIRPSTTRASSSNYKSFNVSSPTSSSPKLFTSTLFLNSGIKSSRIVSKNPPAKPQPKLKAKPTLITHLGKSNRNSPVNDKKEVQHSKINISLNNLSIASGNTDIKKPLLITARPIFSKDPSTINDAPILSKIIDENEISNVNTEKTTQNTWEDIELPATPGVVLKLFKDKLTEYEQGEILIYNNIYYCGINSKKIKPNPKSNFNYGYDNEDGDYEIVINDHIAYRYEIIERIGKGSFGQVLKVYDYKRKALLALKIIKSQSRFQKQAEVEIEVLKFLRKKDEKDNHNIIHIESYFTFRHHICMTFELLGSNLYEFLKLSNFQGFSCNLIRRFGKQILKALKLTEKNQIVHCDLKPENILLKNSNRSNIKIIDFGSSCFIDKQIYTYIQSRFYRAPEIILGISYSPAIDIWSFGCILAELFLGKPLFPGENEADQLLCIMEVLGTPSGELLSRSTRKKMFFSQNNEPKITPNSRGKKRYPRTKDLREILRGAEAGFIELLFACLEWDPDKRITAKDALNHPWLSDEVTGAITKVSSVNNLTTIKAQTTNDPYRRRGSDCMIHNPSFQAKLTARKIGKEPSHFHDN